MLCVLAAWITPLLNVIILLLRCHIGAGTDTPAPMRQNDKLREPDITASMLNPQEENILKHPMTFEDSQEAIKAAMEKNDKPLLKRLMRNSVQGRRSTIQKLEDGTVQKNVEKFPLLKQPEFIILEFESVVELEDTRATYSELLPKLANMLDIGGESDEEIETSTFAGGSKLRGAPGDEYNPRVKSQTLVPRPVQAEACDRSGGCEPCSFVNQCLT